MNTTSAGKPTSAFKVLVIDDQQQVRQIIRESLFRLGFRHVLMAANAAEALKALRADKVDLVLSDYNLGEGPDGQQLLEAARGGRLLSPVAPWIYITANALRADILAAGDFMPDGYIVKPFTDQLLSRYIEGLSARKQALAPLLLASDAQQWEKVLVEAETYIKRGDALSVEGLKHKAQALMRLARFDEAQACYGRALDLNSELAWARLGHAQALRAQGKLDAARSALEQLTKSQPSFASAYDTLLEIAEDLGDQQTALDTARTVADLVPNAKRKIRLGSMALAAGETELALKSLEQAVAKNRHAVSPTHQESVLLAQALLDSGDANRAAALTADVVKRFAGQSDALLLAKAVGAQAQQRLGNEAAAAALMDEVAQDLARAGAQLDEQHKLLLAKSALATGRNELGQQLIGEVARNNSDRPLLLASALRAAAGTAAEAECRALIERANEEMSAALAELQRAKRSGDLAAALEIGEQALQLSPQNFNVLIELCTLHLIAMGRQQGEAGQGLREQHRERARELLTRLEQSHPNHDRVAAARKFFRERAGQS
ncbi:response regulator [Roseateles sp. DAIF2]|uniref:response regulator n=1 Tax=Roseateles sp. DAIF2 TaxID=2714952 RepID=UPI0018A2DBB2|nr:response regulator [Roseateles sp. DAIF2]QPF73720.1 response regulator [Roseateles sp. DAIF2]